MRKSILVNAANLHVGGGVQVAVSYIYEMTLLDCYDFSNISVIVSSKVDEGLSRLRADTRVFRSYKVVDLIGVNAFFSSFNFEVEKYDVVFTVFGPNYLRAQAKKEVLGFAQAWILEFDNELSAQMSVLAAIKARLKRLFQWVVFNRADFFIVELEHVKRKLIESKNVAPDKVEVVHNTVSSLFYDSSLWSDVVVLKESADIHLGIVSRDYIHKNLSVLPELAVVLYDCYSLRVHFYVTFNDAEWEARNDVFKKHVTNVGALLPNECPSFYQNMDGVIFPSLLECFSATPLEALVMGKPLFASDRDFVRDVCGEHAFYFDPLNIDSMAKVIFNYFSSLPESSRCLEAAKQHGMRFSNAKERAVKYLHILNGD